MAAAARRTQTAGTWLVLGRAVRTPRGATGLAWPAVVAGGRDRPAAGPVPAHRAAHLPVRPGLRAVPLLGGDFLGRDVLSRVLDGGWVLLLMAVSRPRSASPPGPAGISAAYLRGRRDGLIMRTVDVILAFPQLVFALLLVSILGPRLWLIVLAVGHPTHPQSPG